MRKLLILPLLFFLLMGCGDGRTDRMRALLHEQDSLNRAYQQLSLDTIRQLTDYFDHHGTNYDRVHAHYLLGSVYRDMGEAPASLAAFQHAIEVADTTAGSDTLYALLAKIHGQMGILFIRQYLPQQAEEAFWEASKNAKQANDILLALDYQRYIVSTFYQRQLFDSIDIFSEQIADELRTLGDTVRAARSLGVAISSNIERDSIEKARRYMDIYEREGDIFDEDNHIRPELAVYNYYRGLYYLKKGDYPLSERLFRQALAHPMDMEQVKGGYLGLRKLFTALGQRDSTLKYTILYADANDTCYARQAREETANMQSLYDYSRHEKEALEKTAEAQRLQKMAIILLGALLLTLFLFWIYRKRKELRFMTMKMDLLTMRQQLGNRERELEKAEQRNDTTKEEITALKGQINTLRSEMNRMRLKEDIAKSLHRTSLLNCSMSDYEWEDVDAYFSENDPDFLALIQDGEDKLSDMEGKVCLLIRLGLSNKDMAVLLNCSSQSLSNLRSSLAQKLFGGKVQTRSIDQKIRVFKCNM